MYYYLNVLKQHAGNSEKVMRVGEHSKNDASPKNKMSNKSLTSEKEQIIINVR
jgi:hypothetical protein